jgi:hypothetical protein
MPAPPRTRDPGAVVAVQGPCSSRSRRAESNEILGQYLERDLTPEMHVDGAIHDTMPPRLISSTMS